MYIKVQKAHRTLNRSEKKRKSLHCIIIKTLKVQNDETILKAVRGRDQVTYKDTPIRIKHDFSSGTQKYEY